MASNREEKKCRICGKINKYCPRCDQKKQSWRMSFCSENCLNFYDIYTGVRDGRYTIAEAHEKILKCDISKIDDEDFLKGLAAKLHEYYNYVPEEAPVEEAADVVESQEEVVEEAAEEVQESAEDVLGGVEAIPVKENNYQKSYGKYNGKHYHKNK